MTFSSVIGFFIACCAFYFLTKSYRTNPSEIKLNQNNTLPKDLKEHEAGILIALMAKVAKADGIVGELEAELISHTLDDVANRFEESFFVREELKKIYLKEKEDFSNVLILAKKYRKITNHAKCLNLLEYILNLAFIDGTFSIQEREITEDIAQAMGIKHAHFLMIITKFEQFYQSRKNQQKVQIDDAYKILNSSKNDDFSVIKKRYRALVKEHHPDILMGQNKSQDIIEQATKKLQQINEAYEIVKKEKSE